MNSQKIKILVLEDSEADFLIEKRALDKHELDAEYLRVDTTDELNEALKDAWDVVITDYTLPLLDFNGAIGAVKRSLPGIPIILVSGTVSEELAVQLLHLGIADFILKGNLARLPNAIRRAMKEAQLMRERSLADRERSLYIQRLEQAKKSIINVITSMAELRDPYTHGHEQRVGDLAADIAREMGLSEEQIDTVRTIGYLHDVGKIGVPAEILVKPTTLEQVERMIIQKHAEQSHAILDKAAFPPIVALAVGQHHERMDGSGYPKGLKGEDIVFEARLLAVADVVEAMSSHRPYRPARGIDAALEELENNRGILYDEACVDCCLRMFREQGYQLQAV